MSIEESTLKSNLKEDSDILEGEFDLVEQKKSVFSWEKYLFMTLVILLIASASFGLGRLSYWDEKKVPVTIKTPQGQPLIESSLNTQKQPTGEVKGASVQNPTNSNSEVVASKNGTKYHFPWCTGAKQISTANKITFASTDEARKAGYTPAANCKGLK